MKPPTSYNNNNTSGVIWPSLSLLSYQLGKNNDKTTSLHGDMGVIVFINTIQNQTQDIARRNIENLRIVMIVVACYW